MVRNESNIPAEWIKPECWPKNKTLGFIRTKQGNVLFHVLNDYSYNTMLSELAFRVDFLSKMIEELEEKLRDMIKLEEYNEQRTNCKNE